MGWSEKIYLVRYLFHFAPEGIAKATNKIDDSSRKISIRSLEVDDDRLIRLETIGKLLGIVKVARGNNMRLCARNRNRSH